MGGLRLVHGYLQCLLTGADWHRITFDIVWTGSRWCMGSFGISSVVSG